MCRVAAPDLVEIYNDYKDRDVVFVSLCRNDRDVAESFAKSTGISWPVGYRADSTIQKLVGVAPCIFVVDRDGCIAWHDDYARLRHHLDAFRFGLRNALEMELNKLVAH